jgi:hypothetical protein
MRDTIQMAYESGFGIDDDGIYIDNRDGICDEELKRFEALVRADEREAMVKVCNEYSATGKIEEFDRGWLACAKNIAATIEARNKE